MWHLRSRCMCVCSSQLLSRSSAWKLTQIFHERYFSSTNYSWFFLSIFVCQIFQKFEFLKLYRDCTPLFDDPFRAVVQLLYSLLFLTREGSCTRKCRTWAFLCINRPLRSFTQWEAKQNRHGSMFRHATQAVSQLYHHRGEKHRNTYGGTAPCDSEM